MQSFSLSAGLGAAILIFTVCIFIWVAYLLKDAEGSAKAAGIIDLSKWAIGTISIALATSIVSDSFKERAQDVNEIAVFEKYVSTFTQTAKMDEKWNLVEYFCAVAPKGNLKDSWENYRLVIKPQYDSFIVSSQKIRELDSVKNRTPKQEAEYSKAVETVVLANKPLISTKENSSLVSKIEIFYLTDVLSEAKPRAEKVKQLLSTEYPDITFEITELGALKNKQSGYRISANEIRFNEDEQALAVEISKTLNQSPIFNLEKPRLKLVQYQTPGYISIFIRNM